MTTGDLVIAATVLGGIIGAFQALIALGDRLWKKPADRQHDSEQSERARQSLECQYQHKELSGVIGTNTEVLKEMVRGNGQLVQTLQSTVEDAKLRHQIIVDKIERIHDAVQHRRSEG